MLMKVANMKSSKPESAPGKTGRKLAEELRRKLELIDVWPYMKVIENNKNASQRLNKFMEMIRSNASKLTQLESQCSEIAQQVDSTWTPESPGHFAFLTACSLDLDKNQIMNEPILKAFEQAQLNPENPISWRWLMFAFCWSHFPPSRQSGAPSYWDGNRYCRLLFEIGQLRLRNRKLSASHACQRLSEQRKFEDRGKPLTAQALRSALRKARDPSHNDRLATLIYTGLSGLREDYQRRGHVWPPVDITRAMDRCRQINDVLGSAGVSRSEPDEKLRADEHEHERRHQKDLEKVRSDRGDIDAFLKASVDQRTALERAIREKLTAYYCEQISSGRVGQNVIVDSSH
jgi:hypothetical protein